MSRIFSITQVIVPWWFDAPSTMGFYGIFFGLFDRLLWCKRFLHSIGVVEVPVLAGNWHGYVSSSFDNHCTRHRVQVRVVQTWTRIAVMLESKSSRSHTLVAAIQVHAPDGVVLSYQYQNEPQPGAVETMQIHHGTARLVLRDNAVLEGQYYSGRGRQEHGSIHLERAGNDRFLG